MTTKTSLSSGGFLFEDMMPQEVFTPEDFSPDQRQIVDMTRRFAAQSVAPVIERIEQKDLSLLRHLLAQAGALGLLAVDVPEEYGGLQLNEVTSALIAEWVSVCASFSVTLVAHSGIGMLPLIWFGTPEQKERYLPRLVSGKYVAAYALSEGTSGSDALNIRTTAKLSDNGAHYVLNGEKMWISNAGIADLFTVFAKIDGNQFSAFLVEASTPGLSIGKEENKMGIRGSSTCSVAMRDCKVPVGNLLGKAGKGHYIAFNVLNIGRCKLGAMVLGGARYALQEAIRYGSERTAFGKKITAFGLIQEKLAESAAMIYAAEAMLYRTVGAIDVALSGSDVKSPVYEEDLQRRISEFAVESSIVKVWCSEMQTTVVDHALQIYGGYGFTEDYPAARHYRDARITRIFEGTNEINRMIITGWTEKKVREKLAELVDENSPVAWARATGDDPLAVVTLFLQNAKLLARHILRLAFETYQEGFSEEQEIAGAFADMIAEVYALESALLRAYKKQSAQTNDLVSYFTTLSRRRIVSAAEKILGNIATDVNAADKLLELLRWRPSDLVTIGRRVAENLLAK